MGGALHTGQYTDQCPVDENRASLSGQFDATKRIFDALPDESVKQHAVNGADMYKWRQRIDTSSASTWSSNVS